MLHLLYGPDDYSSTAALTALLRGSGEDPGGYVTRLDGASCGWASLQELCQSMSLFAAAQVIGVRGLLGAWSGRGESSGGKGSPKPSPAEFGQFVRALPPSTELILQEGDLPATNRYLKELLALAPEICRSRAFPLPGEAALRSWVVQAVRARGRDIEHGAAEEVARRCKGDMWGLANEIDKLLLYRAPDGAIRQEDVALLVPDADDAHAFKLVDAVAAKDAKKVVDLVDRLLGAGEAPEQILALLGTRIRDLSLMAAAGAEGVGQAELGQRTGWSPGRLSHAQRAARDFGRDDLGRAQGLLLATDVALKSRPGHERPLILLLTLLAIAQRKGMVELEQALAL